MSTEEQLNIMQVYYNEAIRYMDNAKENLSKANKKEYRYQDEKYVKTACGIAYNGVLKALDGFLRLKDIPKSRGRKSIFYYQDHLAKLDKKLLGELNDVYNVLHLSGYYDGISDVKLLQSGFDIAYRIIARLKPL